MKVAWCRTHPTKTVGKDSTGEFYKQCYEGYKMLRNGIKPTCEIIIEEVKNSE
jgi:hypothetical protein